MYRPILTCALILAPLAVQGATLEASVSDTVTEGGPYLHATSKWVSADELDISFMFWLEPLTSIDQKSMRFELEGSTLKLYFSLHERDEAPEEGIPLCNDTELLTYKIKGLQHQAYQTQIIQTSEHPVRALPQAPLGGTAAHDPIKVSVLDDGSLLLNGKPATRQAVEQALRDAFNFQTPAWFYGSEPKDPSKAFSPLGEALFDVAIEEQLPTKITRKADFSDLEKKAEQQR